MKDRIRNLDEPNRREFLTRTAAASLGVTIFPQLASGADTIQPASTATAKNVIFLYMSGGMTHVDTFDPKTDSSVKGNTSPIATNADGVQISNLLPKLAQQADKFARCPSAGSDQGTQKAGGAGEGRRCEEGEGELREEEVGLCSGAPSATCPK